MNIEIDQSGKVENTGKDTVIAFSNGIKRSIRIKAKEKRKLQEFFREIDKPRKFVYKTFAILIFLLIKDYIFTLRSVVIDKEYSGQDVIIKSFLLKEIRKHKPEFSKYQIEFLCIGKKSQAHYTAYNTAAGKRKADIEVKAKDIIRAIN